jgi:predicted dehydrogenase
VYAIKGFEHGLHVLSEKPAGVYTKQVREMNERAAQSDRVFGVMFNQRTRTVHQKMRELVQGGTLGEIQRTNYVVTGWFRTQAYYNSGGWRATWAGEGGGVLVNQCPHNLDLFQWICGMPTRCFATCGFGQFHDIEVEDNCTAIFQYANGATGTFVTTTGEAPGAMMLEVCGDRGRLVMEHGKITFWQNQVSAREFLRTNPGSFAKPETWKIEIPGKDEGEEHVGITKNWVNAILNGTPLLASGSEGINGVQLANAMHLAAWTEGWVDMPVDEDLYFAKLQERIAGSTGKKDVTTAANDFAGSF